jgi:hypothetical protein
MSVDTGCDNANAATDFSTCRQVCPQVTFPKRHDKGYLHYHYDGDQLWYTELDIATLAGAKQTTQLLFNIWPSAAAAGAGNIGYLNIYYIIDLYQSVQSRGFTVVRCTHEEREALKEYLRQLREPRVQMIVQTEENGWELAAFPKGKVPAGGVSAKR